MMTRESRIIMIPSMALLACPPDRRVSVVLFGNRHRLDLLAALAEAGDDGTNLSDLAQAHSVSASVYYGPLRDLMDLRLVTRLGSRPGDRRCWYRRSDHRLWENVRSLISALAEVEVMAS
jgi:hypothetical protein